MESILFFIFGTLIGSFLNVVVLRLGTGESITFARSRCYACGTELRWFELIPLLSFLALRGRCRTCRSRISFQYPLIEAVTGAIFSVVYLNWAVMAGDLPTLFAELAFWSAFIALVAYDLRHKILPDSLSAFVAVSALVFRLMSGDFFSAFVAAVLIAAFFASLWVVSSGRWMGLGDAKLFFGTSIFLGWPGALIATLFSFWSGAVLGVLLMFLRRAVTMKTELPFAPFIFFGALAARFFGEAIIGWYLTLI